MDQSLRSHFVQVIVVSVLEEEFEQDCKVVNVYQFLVDRVVRNGQQFVKQLYNTNSVHSKTRNFVVAADIRLVVSLEM